MVGGIDGVDGACGAKRSCLIHGALIACGIVVIGRETEGIDAERVGSFVLSQCRNSGQREDG